MNKKALIVGGNNGIGLAIGHELLDRGYELIVTSRHLDTKNYGSGERVTFYTSDFLDFDQDFFETLTKDESINVLIITAGIGRVAALEYLHPSEIQKTLTVNTVSTLKLLRIFYDRIKNETPFYAGVLVSIAAQISSPLFSVYAASKAAVARFIESVNIELEAAGTQNRILDVSPGTLKGTRFYGGENNLALTLGLAKQIVNHLFQSNELFIPEYEEIYKGVLARYRQDPHEYGLYSYQYKLNSGRVTNKRKIKIGYLSGTFDLFHVGHLNLLRRARQQCDYLIVGVHSSGKWKKKETFIPYEERKEIVGACRYVDQVVESCIEDSDAWDLWHYDILFVGSDYKGTERFQKYEEYFQDKGVDIVYFPYTQGTSSTQLRNVITGKEINSSEK